VGGNLDVVGKRELSPKIGWEWASNLKENCLSKIVRWEKFGYINLGFGRSDVQYLGD
jgi:hypothetical protein